MTGYEYKVGGSLGENATSYVVRQADEQLYYWLQAGEFCYIFNSRQMGKTSILVRVMKRLKAEDFACLKIDFSAQGNQEVSREQWYTGIAYGLVTELKVSGIKDFFDWWDERLSISPVQRLGSLLEELILPNISNKIVMFIDEIDSILSLNFPSDDFFALIRSCYEKRNLNPDFSRLTFTLVGVATPSDLIRDDRRTPFNIGKAIQLAGFKLEETRPLAQGLTAKTNNPMAVMEAVLSWTAGQPFLTQKVCTLILNADSVIPDVEIAAWVKELVEAKIISSWEVQDEPEHLKTIQERILRSRRDSTSRLLGLYQQLLLAENQYHSDSVPILNSLLTYEDSPEQIKLRLTGLVIEQQGRLKIYNKIYASIFNLNWVEKELAKLRPYFENFNAWINSDCTDESRLLRGQTLNSALKWAENKSLSESDYKFFRASQELENRELQAARELEKMEAEINLEAERKKLAAQAKANQILRVATKKAKQQIRFGIVVLFATLSIAVLAGIWITQSLNEAQAATKIERQGINAQKQLEYQEIPALLLAMSAGQDLQKLIKDGRSLEKYPATTPIIALQVILDKIHERNQLSEHQSFVTSVNFSPDGQRIVTASSDNTARIWDLFGKPLGKSMRHQSGVNSANFSPDGQRIITASDDYTVRVWDLFGKPLGEPIMHHDKVNSANFSPDGQRIVTASSDKTARVWDLFGKPLGEPMRHEGWVQSASFSPDGQRIVTASWDKTARVWDLFGKPLGKPMRHYQPVNNANFSPDGQRIVTASYESIARVWDLFGNKLYQVYLDAGYVYSASYSPDGKRIVTTSGDNVVRVWDSSLKKLLVKLAGHDGWVQSGSFSPNGQYIATASDDHTAIIWDLSNKQQPLKLKGHSKSVQSATFSPNGQRIATASEDGTAKIWDLSGKQLLELQGHKDVVVTTNFSPNAQHIVTASKDGTAKIWDLSGHLLNTLKGHGSWVFTASFSPDGQHIVTASNDTTARVWDLSGKPLGEPMRHDQPVNSASFSPDGKRILTASWDNIARVWDLSGHLLNTLKGHRGWVFGGSFSPDGQYIVTASNDTTAIVWDLSGKQLVQLRGHVKAVRSASFSPDGQRIITASDDRTAKVWNLSGMLLAELSGHKDTVWSASFSPDGQHIGKEA